MRVDSAPGRVWYRSTARVTSARRGGACPGKRSRRIFSLRVMHFESRLRRSGAGFEFYTRAARVTKDARGRRVFKRLAEEELEHLEKLEARYKQLLAEDPGLESRPTFLFFKGAANGLFAAGADELSQGVDDKQALLIGIRCERGSHRFFRRYGERFEDSEGKQIFLEFADEEREHLVLLIREYRSLVQRQSKSSARRHLGKKAGSAMA